MSNTDPNSYAPDLPGRGTGTNEYGKVSLTSQDAASRLISSHLWQPAGQPLTITYAYRQDGTPPDEDSTGFQRFTSAQMAATETALSAWSDVANIRFVRVNDGDGYSNNATILFGGYMDGPAAGFTVLPGSRASDSATGDVWINESLSDNQAPARGNYGMEALVHEIGHAPGLTHPGNYDGESTGTYAEDTGYAQDYLQYSVMSYFNQPSAAPDSPGYASVYMPQIDDISAVQRLYGANGTTRAGDTVYGVNSNADQAWFQLTRSSTSATWTLWDAGGVDTLDFSALDFDQSLDLRQGAITTIGRYPSQGSPLGFTIAYAR